MGSILLVDDDLDYADIFAEILREKGHEVRLARDGQEGMLVLRSWLPELAVLDIDMPVLPGPKMALEMFLRDAGAEYIPIIFISGSPELREIAARVGTDYFLAKPAELHVILALIDRALGERRAPTWPQQAPRHA